MASQPPAQPAPAPAPKGRAPKPQEKPAEPAADPGASDPAQPSPDPAATPAAPAQPAATPAKPVPAVGGKPAPKAPEVADPKDRLPFVKQDKPRDWTMRASVQVTAQYEPNAFGIPEGKDFKINTASIVWPILDSTASSETWTAQVTGEVLWDSRPAASKPAGVQQGYPCGTSLAKWEITNLTGRKMELKVEIPMTCFDTVFDEQAARSVAWPSGPWPRTAASALGEDEWVQTNNPRVQDLVKKWTAGKDPKALPPVQLAKFLAGRVLEEFQPSGDGLSTARTGEIEGVALRRASDTIRDGKGSEHDIAVVLASVYRAAGLPARTVIGYDIGSRKGNDDKFLSKGTGRATLRSWVEFYLYDERAQADVWVPVDVIRMRKSGNRARPLDQAWKFFGTNDELSYVMPVSFQYHPPTSVVAHGALGFWGWSTTPGTQIAEQVLRFSSIRTPKSSESDRRPKKTDPTTK